jgi:hypothetical protein
LVSVGLAQPVASVSQLHHVDTKEVAMGVVAKMFIQSVSEQPDGSRFYNLGVVCRGEENKSWAAATPSGSMKHGVNELLAAVWDARITGSCEVEVLQTPDPEGAWVMDKCDFTYGGCAVHFRQKDAPWGTLDLTINASGATKVLRDEYAAGLVSGVAPRFSVTFR